MDYSFVYPELGEHLHGIGKICTHWTRATNLPASPKLSISWTLTNTPTFFVPAKPVEMEEPNHMAQRSQSQVRPQ